MLFSEVLEVIDPEPHGAALNMAIDEILLRQVERPTLRIYRWAEPAVSFGYFGRIDEVEGVARGRSVVRRWTGGGMVEHGEDVTYTLLIPREHAFLQHSAPESYRLIHEIIARILEGEGMAAQVVSVPDAQAASACFVSPVRYDLVADGKKIAGAAQRRTRWGLLHQGSIQTNAPVTGLGEKLTSAFGENLPRRYLTPALLIAAQMLAETKYGTTAWLRKY